MCTSQSQLLQALPNSKQNWLYYRAASILRRQSGQGAAVTNPSIYSPLPPTHNPSCMMACLRIRITPCVEGYLEVLKAPLQLGDVGGLALQHLSETAYVGVDRAPWLVNLRVVRHNSVGSCEEQ